MAHCEIFKSPNGKWYWIALWNDARPQLSDDAYPTPQAAFDAAQNLPLTILYRHGLEGLRTDQPNPDIHAG
jgi:hypothetical protein